MRAFIPAKNRIPKPHPQFKVMIKLSYSEIQEHLDRLELDDLPEIKISILRNIVIEPIEPYLKYLAWQAGFRAQIRFGNYDNVIQEAVGGDRELLNSAIDCVLIFLKLDNLSWDLARNFNALTDREIQAETERVQDYLNRVLSGIRSQTAAIILWHGFELPSSPATGIIDSQIDSGQSAVIGRLNVLLKESLRSQANSYFVDLNLCRLRVGDKQFYDPRYWHIGRAPYSREALREISEEAFKFIRSLKGKSKKCLVLDCDNILWGGIIGEDGLSGIKLGKTYPGSAYYEFQQEVLNLYNKGVILALCSKNNEEDVWEVFRKHPHMLLEEKHIAAFQINWNDKAANLRLIAGDLNIGLDSMVYADDSEFEINLIRQFLPEVEVIYLPADRAVENRDILAGCGMFETLSLSEEDKKRGAFYKAETGRKKLRAQATDLTDYLKSLEMVINIGFADEFTIPRIAQLTQRTNQFNLTTRRYSEAEINDFSENDGSDVLYLRLNDRFGDSGIVGACILQYESEKAIIDTFLLSCRVLGRGVEDAFLINVLKLAGKRGCQKAVGIYFATRKNVQVKDFYQKHGFKEWTREQDGEGKTFLYELKRGLEPEPDFFKKITLGIDQNRE